jgi:hypothetical protein
MGLLRASVDAVMVGSGTVRDAGLKHLWIPEFIYPEAKDLYAHYRTTVLRKPNQRIHWLSSLAAAAGLILTERYFGRRKCAS